MEQESRKKQMAKDAVKAISAVAILILIGLVMTAGIFGADYGARKVQAQTRKEMEGFLDGYGLTAEQKEALYAELLGKMQKLLEEYKKEGALTQEEREKLKTELAEELQKEFEAYLTWDNLQKIINEIWEALEGQELSREEMLRQVTTMYEQYTKADEEKWNRFEIGLGETEQKLQSQLEKEIRTLRETLTEQIRVHSKELAHMQKAQESLENQLAGEKAEREKEYQKTVEQMKSFGEEMDTLRADLGQMQQLFLEELAQLAERVTKNEEDMQTVFQLVSNGKKLLASAITDKGVKTAEDATFETMAENIRSMAEYQYQRGYAGAPAAISEFYLNMHFLDNSGPLHNCWYTNYVTFRVDAAESVTIGSITTTVDGRTDPEFAAFAVVVSLDGQARYTLEQASNYTIPTNGAKTMTLHMVNRKGDERFMGTAVVKNLRLNSKQPEEQQNGVPTMLRARMAMPAPKQDIPELQVTSSGTMWLDSNGKEIMFEELLKQADENQNENQIENQNSTQNNHIAGSMEDSQDKSQDDSQDKNRDMSQTKSEEESTKREVSDSEEVAVEETEKSEVVVEKGQEINQSDMSVEQEQKGTQSEAVFEMEQEQKTAS